MSTFADAFAPTENTEFQPLPDGTYEARLKDVTTEANPFDQQMQTTMEYEITNGENKSRRIWDTVKHVDTVAWKAARIYKSFGLQGTPSNFEEWSKAVAGCKGRSYNVETMQRSSGDKVYINVKSVTPLGDQQVDEIPF